MLSWWKPECCLCAHGNYFQTIPTLNRWFRSKQNGPSIGNRYVQRRCSGRSSSRWTASFHDICVTIVHRHRNDTWRKEQWMSRRLKSIESFIARCFPITFPLVNDVDGRIIDNRYLTWWAFLECISWIPDSHPSKKLIYSTPLTRRYFVDRRFFN